MTMPGDPTKDSVYQSVTTDITSAVGGGGTFQLRFAEMDNQGQFEFGIDNVRISLGVANVSSQVQVSNSGFGRNRASGLWSATLTVKNIGEATLAGPIQVALTALTAGVTMTNNTGTVGTDPYITVSAAGLVPGASVTVTIQFNNPSNGFIAFTPVTYSGTF